jgi:hypothetical protein
MRRKKVSFAWRQVLLVASIVFLAHSTHAQGSGPPRGMEALLWLFMAGAALFVLLTSAVLFLVGKRAFFKDRKASPLAKFILFAASILTSCVAGVVIMIVFDIR